MSAPNIRPRAHTLNMISNTLTSTQHMIIGIVYILCGIIGGCVGFLYGENNDKTLALHCLLLLTL